MADSYTKLFRGITASTIVSEPLATRWLWVTFLAQSDKAGNVWGSVPGMARLANITIEECEQGLAALASPDPYSRTRDNDGRRIAPIDGGWHILNHAKYDAIRGAEERKEYKRQWDRDNRSKAAREAKSDKSDKSDKNPTKPTDPTPPAPTPPPPPKKEDQKPSAPRGARLPADWTLPDEWRGWAEQERPDVDVSLEAASFADYWHAKAGRDGVKLDWFGTWRNWVRRASARRGIGSAPRPSAMERVMTNIKNAREKDAGQDPLLLEGQHVRLPR